MSETPDIPEDDPTRDVWLSLLRRHPGKGTGKSPSVEERREKSRHMREFYETRPHPRQGRTVAQPAADMPAVGVCRYCGLELRSEHSAEQGIGAQCLRVGVQNGDIMLKNGRYVLRRRKRRP